MTTEHQLIIEQFEAKLKAHGYTGWLISLVSPTTVEGEPGSAVHLGLNANSYSIAKIITTLILQDPQIEIIIQTAIKIAHDPRLTAYLKTNIDRNIDE